MKKLLAIALIAALSGCASYRPIVDTKGVDMNAYQADLTECQQYAKEVNPAATAAGTGIAGAFMGALLGAAIGGRGSAGYGARIGAAEGIGGGAAHGASAQIAVVKNCMAGRGYRVLV